MNATHTNADTTLWTIDSMHTTVGFAVRHLMITNVRGVFQQVSGTVRYNKADPKATVIEASIPADSISTSQAQRDGHLRGADFFDAEKHPTITFRSTGVRSANGNDLELAGSLTLRGVTRDVTLAVVGISGEQKDHNGKTRLGASATATIKRSDFGMTYNRILETGGVAVSDDVALTFDLSLVKSDAS